MANRIYLGDDIYAEIQDEQLVLTTDNGADNLQDEIVLEREAFEGLTKWLKEVWV